LLIETRSTNTLIVNQPSKINNQNFPDHVAAAASAVQAKAKAGHPVQPR